MKRAVFFLMLLMGVSSAAHADDSFPFLGIELLYVEPTQTIDFFSAVWLVASSSGVDNLYAVDINGFDFTSTNTDDQSDPISLDPESP